MLRELLVDRNGSKIAGYLRGCVRCTSPLFILYGKGKYQGIGIVTYCLEPSPGLSCLVIVFKPGTFHSLKEN